jgi:hypothetical protein
MPGNDRVPRGLDAAQVEALIKCHFPQIHVGGRAMLIEEAGERRGAGAAQKKGASLATGRDGVGPDHGHAGGFFCFTSPSVRRSASRHRSGDDQLEPQFLSQA